MAKENNLVGKDANVCCKDNGPFVGIGASLGGIFMVIAVIFVVFARDQLMYLVGIAWGFVMLGIFLGLFAYLSIKNRNNGK